MSVNIPCRNSTDFSSTIAQPTTGDAGQVGRQNSTLLESVKPEFDIVSPPEGYCDLTLIGKGASSLVYAATCRNSGCPVALKQLRPELREQKDVLNSFLNEARILMSLKHPNIIRCIDYFFDCQTFWIVLERIQGGTLKDHLEREPGNFGKQQLSRWIEQVAEALRFIHSKQIVHRDIKPANILLQGNRAVLADFGLACSLPNSGTRPDRICGTPQYMSDEALRGITTPANDRYALRKTCEKIGLTHVLDFHAVA